MIRLIVWIFIGLLALSFFGISLRSLFESQTNQDNLAFLWTMVQMGWNYLITWLEGFFSTFAHLGQP